jgi:hypothetical protein
MKTFFSVLCAVLLMSSVAMAEEATSTQRELSESESAYLDEVYSMFEADAQEHGLDATITEMAKESLKRDVEEELNNSDKSIDDIVRNVLSETTSNLIITTPSEEEARSAGLVTKNEDQKPGAPDQILFFDPLTSTFYELESQLPPFVEPIQGEPDDPEPSSTIDPDPTPDRDRDDEPEFYPAVVSVPDPETSEPTYRYVWVQRKPAPSTGR